MFCLVRELDGLILARTSHPDVEPGIVAVEGSHFGMTHIIEGTPQAVADPEQERRAWKAQRVEQVASIKVTVDELQFDGDETSQDRMARTIAAAGSNDETINWRLADNSAAQVTVAQLKQALRLAGRAQEALWHPSEAV